MLLAAGAGKRFGMPKALIRHRGRLFVEAGVGVLRQASCRPVVVVLGASSVEVRTTASLPHVDLVDNPDWASGMGSSLKAGLHALTTSDAVAVAILPVDTPGVTAAAVRRVAALASPTVLARATFRGWPGHPVLIGRVHWAGVAELAAGDTGARRYLADHPATGVPCEDIATGEDVDRPEDLPK
jgi:CTP:molybdopterin cytidylyltransferase MocA